MKKLILIFLLFAINVMFASHNVSDMNGDLSYKYPISSHLVKGHNLEVDITYNTNVSHVSMVHYMQDKNKFFQYSLPMPLWTINVNGFALNALSHNINPYSSDYRSLIKNYPNTDTVLKNVEFLKNAPIDDDFNNGYLRWVMYNNIWLIEGYDFCNRMSVLEDGDIDEIKLLRGDGSVLRFKNQNRYKDEENLNDSKYYTGLYYHDSYNSNIYAKVEFDSTSHFPDYITNLLPSDDNRVQHYPRVMKVYMGDGLEYVFKEWISPYGARIIDKIYQRDSTNQLYSDSLKIDIYPTIFYLEAINTSIGEMTSFSREHHIFNDSEVDVYKGHAWTTDFYGHHIDNSTENIIIDAYGKSYKIKNMIQPLNFISEYNNLEVDLGKLLIDMFADLNDENTGLGLLKIMDKSNELYSNDINIDTSFSTSMLGEFINPKSYHLYPERQFGRYFKQHITDIIDP